MNTDFRALKKHIAEVVSSSRMWAGVFDENMEWLCDIELSEFEYQQQRNAMSSFKAKAVVSSYTGVPRPAVHHLVGENIGMVDSRGALVPVTAGARFLVVERSDSARVAGRIGFTVASGEGNTPSVLEINGITLIGELELLPCPSNIKAWDKTHFTTFDRVWGSGKDAGIVLDKPRQLADINTATVADGFTEGEHGTAEETVRKILKDSFNCIYKLCGIPQGSYPLAVSDKSTGKKSPNVLIKPSDGTILTELAETMSAAGISLNPYLWFPSDIQPEGLQLTQPTIVFDVLQG